MFKMIIKKLTNSESRKRKKLGSRLRITEYALLPKFCLKGGPLLQNLKEKGGASFKIEGEQLRISVGGINYLVNSWEELNILHEVFVEGIYNITLGNPYVLIDIGMNVGVTSLFFSAKPECKKIISFEPFAKTAERARANFALNSFSDKISAHQYGLGFPARNLAVQYSEEFKGSVGIDGLGEHIKGTHNLETADMDIKDVYEEVKQILTEEENVVMKIDCEGAEYEILNRLNEMNVIGKPKCFMIEWHRLGPEELKKTLIKNGFRVISFNDKSTDIGMLYAFNTR